MHSWLFEWADEKSFNPEHCQRHLQQDREPQAAAHEGDGGGHRRDLERTALGKTCGLKRLIDQMMDTGGVGDADVIMVDQIGQTHAIASDRHLIPVVDQCDKTVSGQRLEIQSVPLRKTRDRQRKRQRQGDRRRERVYRCGWDCRSAGCRS